MVEFAIEVVANGLFWMFAVGVAGCAIVIPWAAIKMFAALFEKDSNRTE